LVVDWRVAVAPTEIFLPISATINNQVIRGVAMSARWGGRIDGGVGGHGGALLPKAFRYRITTVTAIVDSKTSCGIAIFF
jgi:hypothetical protein